MFEIGCDYKITMLEYGENYEGKYATYETSRVFECAAVDGNLIKLLGPDFSEVENSIYSTPGLKSDQPREEIILSTSSLFFVKAEKVSKS